MGILSIDETNIDQEHICCALGADAANRARSRTKKEWLKARFPEGLVFKRLDERGKVFIEYLPVENAWKPLEGRGSMVINCLWVSGKFKGRGLSSLLLEECLADAREKGLGSLSVVVSSAPKPFLTDKSFYLAQGFAPADAAAPYFELLALRLRADAVLPRFTDAAKTGRCALEDRGLVFIYSDQCPFMEEYVGLMAAAAAEREIPVRVHRLADLREAKTLGSPTGTLGIYYDGGFLTHELMPEKKFSALLDTLKR